MGAASLLGERSIFHRKHPEGSEAKNLGIRLSNIPFWGGKKWSNGRETSERHDKFALRIEYIECFIYKKLSSQCATVLQSNCHCNHILIKINKVIACTVIVQVMDASLQ